MSSDLCGLSEHETAHDRNHAREASLTSSHSQEAPVENSEFINANGYGTPTVRYSGRDPLL